MSKRKKITQTTTNPKELRHLISHVEEMILKQQEVVVEARKNIEKYNVLIQRIIVEGKYTTEFESNIK